MWIFLFLGLAACFAVDGMVMEAVRPLPESHFADVVRQVVRPLGTGEIQVSALLLLIVVGMFGGRIFTRAGCWGLWAFLAAGAAVHVLKVLVHRARPWVLPAHPESIQDWIKSDYGSFPSGESTTTFALVTTLSAFFPRFRFPLFLLASLVAVGRVVVGSHHPSDVWAGGMLGIAVGSWLIGVAKGRERKGGGD